MGRVNVLDKKTAELIAAGEVVERPASVIKELVENAIDAGAHAVTVEIKAGGVRYMRVTDDGEGIVREDVPLAFLRHATSKISKGTDLDAIATLGFRGEALASVAAVARVELITATADSECGTHYVIEGGEEQSCDDCGCARGTTIVVRDLFFNTPARLKFLKKDTQEGNAVASLLDRLALSHPDVAFRFVREGKQVLATSGDGKLSSAIYSVFGKDFYSGLIPAEGSYNGVRVEGYISKPTESRPNSAMQVFFINGRYCRSNTMQFALEAAYRGAIMVGRRPACVLRIELDCSAVDVNVHPAKLEVRFTNEKPIFDAVYAAAKNALAANDSRREIHIPERPVAPSLFSPPQPAPPVQRELYEAVRQSAEPPREAVDEAARRAVHSEQAAAPCVAMRDSGSIYDRVGAPDRHAISDRRGSGSIDITAEELAPDEPIILEPTPPVIVEPPVRETAARLDSAPAPVSEAETERPASPERPAEPEQPVAQVSPAPYRIVGEAFDTYILVESGDELVVIDKHAAHERLIYERLLRDGKTGRSQLLLEPVSLTLEKLLCDALLENLSLLTEAGFDIEGFGPGTVLIRAVPMALEPCEAAAAVEEIAGNLGKRKDALLTDRMNAALHTIACRSAIKGGDRSRPEELAALVAQLRANPDVRYCPHGRPIYTALKRRELEKSFGRI